MKEKEKTYTVNVHYTQVHTMKIKAYSVEQAQDIARENWSGAWLGDDEMEDVDIDVTEISEISK